MKFEWDDKKNATNLEKHGIDFSMAIAIFDDPNRLEEDCSRLEDNEERVKTVGMIDGVLFVLAVVYMNRNQNLRIISARKASRAERKRYNESLIN